jgi:hypothetical protein
MFSGYYGILMAYFGLSGFGNGVGYGEWRDSGYHKGGMAVSRVYLLRLHRFLDAPNAQAMIERDPDYFGLDTDILAECVASGRPVSDLTNEECLDHFLECRKLEVEFVSNQPLASAVDELGETLERLSAWPLERDRYGASLERWRNSISG